MQGYLRLYRYQVSKIDTKNFLFFIKLFPPSSRGPQPLKFPPSLSFILHLLHIPPIISSPFPTFPSFLLSPFLKIFRLKLPPEHGDKSGRLGGVGGVGGWVVFEGWVAGWYHRSNLLGIIRGLRASICAAGLILFLLPNSSVF